MGLFIASPAKDGCATDGARSESLLGQLHVVDVLGNHMSCAVAKQLILARAKAESLRTLCGLATATGTLELAGRNIDPSNVLLLADELLSQFSTPESSNEGARPLHAIDLSSNPLGGATSPRGHELTREVDADAEYRCSVSGVLGADWVSTKSREKSAYPWPLYYLSAQCYASERAQGASHLGMLVDIVADSKSSVRELCVANCALAPIAAAAIDRSLSCARSSSLVRVDLSHNEELEDAQQALGSDKIVFDRVLRHA